MHSLRVIVALMVLFGWAPQSRADTINSAFNDAIALFERAAPQLPSTLFDVDTAAFRDALRVGRFTSSHWGDEIVLELSEQGSASGSCARYAAFVRIPPQQGRVSLVLCPQFSAEGTSQLRRLTLLHEMVHVVAGGDECRAMAFAAAIEQAATGSFTRVERYWQANNCDGSRFSLP